MASPDNLLVGKRICVVTSGHVASDPRAVKEADAMVEAGARVTVVAAQTLDRLKAHDAKLVARRRWRFVAVDVTASGSGTGRIVNAALSRMANFLPDTLWRIPGVAETAWSRITLPLQRAAEQVDAELYIAHNLAALPAAAQVAAARGAKLGFDAEDLHSEEPPDTPDNRRQRRLARMLEDRYMPRCDYLTASAPLISAHYAARFQRQVATILNVFPLSDRPTHSAPRRNLPSLYWFSQTIGPGRGLEQVIEAIGLMKRPVELHLRGAWAEGYEVHLRKLAAGAGIAQRLYAHPVESPERMIGLAAEHDIGLSVELVEVQDGKVIFSNRIVCLSNKLFTYLLAGVPVILSETPAQAALANELKAAAALVPLDRPEATAATLDEWVSDRPVLAGRKRQALCLAMQRFTWDLEKQTFLKLIADNLLRTF